MQFTVELQDSRTKSINFLDVTVYNANGRIKTNWYCKPIASNRLINFYSAHPMQMKFNTAVAFARRVLRVSHSSFHSDNLLRIRGILAKNNFPSRLVNKVINQARSTNQQSLGATHRSSSISSRQHSYPYLSASTVSNIDTASLITQPIQSPIRYTSMSYVPRITDHIVTRFQQFLPNVKIARKPSLQAGSIYTHLKKKLDNTQKSNVVYKIDCRNCDKCYIGETTVRLQDRIEQHKYDVTRMNIKASTALVAHQHQFDFDGVSVLKQEEKQAKLKIDAINQIIMHRDTACNYKSDSAHVTPAYYNLILANETRRRPPQMSIHDVLSSTHN